MPSVQPSWQSSSPFLPCSAQSLNPRHARSRCPAACTAAILFPSIAFTGSQPAPIQQHNRLQQEHMGNPRSRVQNFTGYRKGHELAWSHADSICKLANLRITNIIHFATQLQLTAVFVWIVCWWIRCTVIISGGRMCAHTCTCIQKIFPYASVVY